MRLLLLTKTPAYLLFLALQLSLTACSTPEPEQAIEDQIAQLQDAAIRGDSGDLLDILSDHAEVQYGPHTLSKKEVNQRLVGLFFRYPKRQVTLTRSTIDFNAAKTKAQVQLTALAWGGRSTLPESATSFQIDSHWHDDGNGEWRITQFAIRH